jgi:hypothetical protein
MILKTSRPPAAGILERTALPGDRKLGDYTVHPSRANKTDVGGWDGKAKSWQAREEALERDLDLESGEVLAEAHVPPESEEKVAARVARWIEDLWLGIAPRVVIGDALEDADALARLDGVSVEVDVLECSPMCEPTPEDGHVAEKFFDKPVDRGSLLAC